MKKFYNSLKINYFFLKIRYSINDNDYYDYFYNTKKTYILSQYTSSDFNDIFDNVNYNYLTIIISNYISEFSYSTNRFIKSIKISCRYITSNEEDLELHFLDKGARFLNHDLINNFIIKDSFLISCDDYNTKLDGYSFNHNIEKNLNVLKLVN